MNRASDAKFGLDSLVNTTKSVNEEVPTVTISKYSDAFQEAVFDDEEDVLLTREDFADINALSFLVHI